MCVRARMCACELVSVCVYECVHARLCVSVHVRLCEWVHASLWVCLSVRPYVRPTDRSPVLPFVCLSVCLCVYVCLSVCLSVCPSIRLPVDIGMRGYLCGIQLAGCQLLLVWCKIMQIKLVGNIKTRSYGYTTWFNLLGIFKM